MPQTGALGLLATLATMKVAVPKRIGPSRTQLQIGLNMLANELGSYKEPQLALTGSAALKQKTDHASYIKSATLETKDESGKLY